MADIAQILASRLAPASSGGKRPSAPQGYSFAEEVSRRANVMSDQDSPQNQASLKRLKRAMESGQALRGDVPRGFYLDLKL